MCVGYCLRPCVCVLCSVFKQQSISFLLFRVFWSFVFLFLRKEAVAMYKRLGTIERRAGFKILGRGVAERERRVDNGGAGARARGGRQAFVGVGMGV